MCCHPLFQFDCGSILWKRQAFKLQNSVSSFDGQIILMKATGRLKRSITQPLELCKSLERSAPINLMWSENRRHWHKLLEYDFEFDMLPYGPIGVWEGDCSTKLLIDHLRYNTYFHSTSIVLLEGHHRMEHATSDVGTNKWLKRLCKPKKWPPWVVKVWKSWRCGPRNMEVAPLQKCNC